MYTLQCGHATCVFCMFCFRHCSPNSVLAEGFSRVHIGWTSVPPPSVGQAKSGHLRYVFDVFLQKRASRSMFLLTHAQIRHTLRVISHFSHCFFFQSAVGALGLLLALSWGLLGPFWAPSGHLWVFRKRPLPHIGDVFSTLVSKRLPKMIKLNQILMKIGFDR